MALQDMLCVLQHGFIAELQVELETQDNVKSWMKRLPNNLFPPMFCGHTITTVSQFIMCFICNIHFAAICCHNVKNCLMKIKHNCRHLCVSPSLAACSSSAASSSSQAMGGLESHFRHPAPAEPHTAKRTHRCVPHPS